MSTKLIVIGPLPPPYYGQSVGFASLCKELKTFTNCHVVDIQPKYTMPGSGWKASRVFEYLKCLSKFFYFLMKTKQNCIVYITIAQSNAGFVRDFAFIMLSCFFKRKVIVHLKGGNFNNFFLESSYFQKIIIKFLYKKVHKIIVLGNSLKNSFDFSKEIKQKTVVIENGLTDDTFSIKNKCKKSNNKFNILYLSNLIISKGYLDLLDSLKYFEMQTLDYKCTIAGNIYTSPDDPETMDIKSLEDNIKKKLNELKNKENVKYIGPVEGDAKIKLLVEADVFVLPTYYINEGQPISIIEAMAYKNAIISTKYRSIQDLVTNNKEGFLLKPKNPKDIADKLQFLFDNKNALRKIQYNAFQKFTKNFTREKHIKKMLKVLEIN